MNREPIINNQVAISLIILIGSIFVFSISSCTTPLDDFFLPTEKDLDHPVQEFETRVRLIEPNLSLLPNISDIKSSGGKRIKINLFSDTSYIGIINKGEKNSTGGVTYHGEIEGNDNAYFILVVDQGLMEGYIRIGTDMFTISFSGDGKVHKVAMIDTSLLPKGSEPKSIYSKEQDPNSLEKGDKLDDGSQIDVMVIYTARARGDAGGVIAMQNKINLALASTNRSFEYSGINTRLRLVHTAEVNLNESDNFINDLDSLVENSMGLYDHVHQKRDNYKADVVTIIVDDDAYNGSYSGYSNLMSDVSPSFESQAFNLVTDASMITGYAHEFGHIMGARHEWYIDQSTEPFEYAHGYVYISSDQNNNWHTIMAYGRECDDTGVACRLIDYWSNPELTYQGVPLGLPHTDSEPADNAAVLNYTADVVANFRTSSSSLSDRYESDNDPDQATDLNSNTPQTHSIYPTDDKDWYSFELEHTTAVSIGLSSIEDGIYLSLYRHHPEENGVLIGSELFNGLGSTEYYYNECQINALPPGSYYVKISTSPQTDTVPAYTITLEEDEVCVTEPEISITTDSGQIIVNGDVLPRASKGTDFGEVQVLGEYVTQIFQIWNHGSAPLILYGSPSVEMSGPDSVDFQIVSQPENNTIDPDGNYLSFQIRFNPFGVEERTAYLNVESNDPDRGLYQFMVKGSGIGEPEITVRNNYGVEISNGETTISSILGTDFRSRSVENSGQGTEVKSFQLRNLGGDLLFLSGTPIIEISGTHPDDFSVTESPETRILQEATQPGQSTEFQITFDPVSTGTRSAEVLISNSDEDENPYSFAIQGEGTGSEQPEIELVSSSGVVIENGDFQPSSLDGTRFGFVALDGGVDAHLFRIQNLGGESLELTGQPMISITGEGSSDFAITTEPVNTTIDPDGNYAEFEISFDPQAPGPRQAEICIQNSDLDESLYCFQVIGNDQQLISLGDDYEGSTSFGASVSISGDVAIIGAPTDIVDGVVSGAAYIYEVNNGSWTQVARISPAGSHPGAEFGASVSIDGETVIVGAPGFHGGVVYIFEMPGSGWQDMDETAWVKVDGSIGDRFGHSLDIHQNTVVVGAPHSEQTGTDSGAAYIFVKPPGGWTNNKTSYSTLVPGDHAADQHFGWSVALDSGSAIVGAVADEYGGKMRGAAYIYTAEAKGWRRTVQTEEAKITPDDHRMANRFGWSVDILGSTAVVGDFASGFNGPGSGSVYVYQEPDTGWRDMNETIHILPETSNSQHWFGFSISLSDSLLLVGTNKSENAVGDLASAALFRNDTGEWIEQNQVVGQPGLPSDLSGWSVSLSDGYAVVGSPGNPLDDTPGHVLFIDLLD